MVTTIPDRSIRQLVYLPIGFRYPLWGRVLMYFNQSLAIHYMPGSLPIKMLSGNNVTSSSMLTSFHNHNHRTISSRAVIA